jgi:hypothetical protein
MIDMATGMLVTSSMPAGRGQGFLTYTTIRLVGKLASPNASNGTRLWSPTKWVILANILVASMNYVVQATSHAFGLENEEAPILGPETKTDIGRMGKGAKCVLG